MNEQRRFMDLSLMIAPGVLAPRPETELLGQTARRQLEALDAAQPRVIDMCCGSGNLACALAVAAPRAKLWACDLTEACVDLCQRNVERLGLSARIAVCQGDLFAPLEPGLHGTIDLVVCNPPYISSGRLARDRAELLVNEPREAFDGGPFGISVQQRVVRGALPFLRPGGWLMFEIGLGQHHQMQSLFARARSYDDIHPVCNDAGEVRVMTARKRS